MMARRRARDMALELGFGPVPALSLSLWLEMELGADDRRGDAVRLFEGVRAARDAGRRAYHVWGDDRRGGPTAEPRWIVRVAGDRAIVHVSPAIHEPWLVAVDELLALVMRWFAQEGPAVAARLRDIVEGPRGVAPPPVATAGSVLAAVLAVETPTAAAVGRALGVALELVRRIEPNETHRARFADGPYSGAELRINVQRGSGTLAFQPRFSSLYEIEASELGAWGQFAGFEFRMGQSSQKVVVEVGDRSLHLVEPFRPGDAPAVAVHWAARARAAPLASCEAPPERIPPWSASASMRPPRRFWVELVHAGDRWRPEPLPAASPGAVVELVLVNLASVPGMAAHRGDRLRCTFEVVAREQRTVPGSDRIRDTFHARILDVCVAARGVHRGLRSGAVVMVRRVPTDAVLWPVASPADPATRRCTPGIGDRGAVVEVLRAGAEERFVVESVGGDGRTRWIAELGEADLALASVHPFEPLVFSPMASGQWSLRLGDRVPSSAFDGYAESVAARLGAEIVDRVDGPGTRVWMLARDGLEYRLSWEDHPNDVSLEPATAAAGATMDAVRAALRGTAGAADVVFRVRRDADGRPRLATGCAELDTLLGDDLGTGDPDEDSLELEIAQGIRDVRRGTVPFARNGSDAVLIEIAPAGVRLEYAFPGAWRPGALLAMASFVDVFVRWFETVHPALGARLGDIAWP